MTTDFKTQTPRSTKFHQKITNINLFCNNFEFGIVTSQDWGDFRSREDPLITLEIEGTPYEMTLSEFIQKAKRFLK